MKVLYRGETQSIVIIDDNNYATGHLETVERKDKVGIVRPVEQMKQNTIAYHNTLNAAVEEVARLEANKTSVDLHTWLVGYQKCLEYFREVFEGENV